MMVRLSRMNSRNGIRYRNGVTSQAMTFVRVVQPMDLIEPASQDEAPAHAQKWKPSRFRGFSINQIHRLNNAGTEDCLLVKADCEEYG
jgi:hypothetical protein